MFLATMKSQNKIIKSKFTPEEDKKLISLVENAKDVDWSYIASQLPNRNSRQCRERWQNYLNPELKNQTWTEEEDQLILDRYNEMGPHWNAIGRTFVGRSGNSVRNRYLVLMRHQQKKQRKTLKDFENYEIKEKKMPALEQPKLRIVAQPTQQTGMTQFFNVPMQFTQPAVQNQQQTVCQTFTPFEARNPQVSQEKVDEIDGIFGNIELIFQDDNEFSFLDALF